MNSVSGEQGDYGQHLVDDEAIGDGFANEQILSALLMSEQTQGVVSQIASDVRKLLANSQNIKDVGSVDEHFVAALGVDLCENPQQLESILAEALNRNGGEQISIDKIIECARSIELEEVQDRQASEAAGRLLMLGIDHNEIARYLKSGSAEHRKLIISLNRLLGAPGMEVLVDYIYETCTTSPMSFGEALELTRDTFRQINSNVIAAEEGDDTARRIVNNLAETSDSVRQRIAGLDHDE